MPTALGVKHRTSATAAACSSRSSRRDSTTLIKLIQCPPHVFGMEGPEALERTIERPDASSRPQTTRDLHGGACGEVGLSSGDG